jgi:hypothetical protein
MKYVKLFLGLLVFAFITCIGSSVVMLFLSYHQPAGFAEDTLREIKWSDPNLRDKLTAGEIIEPNADCPFAQLKIQNTQDEKKTFSILTISDPCITSNRYALTGMVKYESVQLFGYLEMWSYFPNGEMHFSRGQDDSGPMQFLNGSSNWRPFTLPFDTIAANRTPTKLDFNIILPLRGTVYLGPLKLVQFEKSESAATKTNTAANAWWTDRTAGWLFGGIGGGVGGSVIGTIGLFIGILSWLGAGRRVCFWLLGIMFVFGLTVLMLGIVGSMVALGRSQPYAVWYSLLILGVALGLPATILPLALFHTIKLRYEQAELRKMHAMDIK